jgi:predicted lipoprotein with Yx(FWY)xxD motif
MKKVYLLLILSVFLFTGCNNNNDGDIDPDPKENSVKLSNNAKFGKILTDSKGLSLYFFSKDTKETSDCLDGCLDVWPIFYAEDLTVDSGLNLSDFATITRTDGLMQTTYRGWPLYYFANDAVSGDTNGDKVNNVWYIAKPDYSLMYVVSQLIGEDGKKYKSDYTEGEGATFYITDIEGQTLYTFIKDNENSNNFTKEDFSNNSVWPIVEINLDKIPSILDANDFNTIDVFGRTQLTYKGRPLYYYGQDSERGDNKGVSFPVPGGIWPIANTETTQANPASVKIIENETLGKILTDKDGMSLYFFSKDSKGTSECLDGCLSNWPVFYDENLKVNNDLDFADFGTISRSDGEMQNTYKGWPLYYFANDTQAGDTNGDNVNNVWFVAKPDYTLMYVAAQLTGHDGLNYMSDYTPGDGLTKYITDISGKTLYIFKNDTKDNNTFTKDDFSNNGVWPIAEITLDKIPSNLDANDFSSIDVYGKTQITYKGWPLYYFGQDLSRGDNKGISFPVPGVWPIANTDTPMAPAP